MIEKYERKLSEMVLGWGGGGRRKLVRSNYFLSGSIKTLSPRKMSENEE